MKRAILLQIGGITNSKRKILRASNDNAISEFNRIFDERDHCLKFMDFHRKVYSSIKENTSFNSQVVCDLERKVWKSRGKARRLTIQFNVPRNCKTNFETKSNFFIELGIRPRNRIAVPIEKNRNYQRFTALLDAGWSCKTYGLTSNLQIVAYLSKEEIPIAQRKNVLGIDINAKHFAVSVVSPQGDVLYQTYFGRRIYAKRKKIMERRSRLQSLDARKALKRLRTYESDFVKTNLGQMVREIMNLALRFDADIAIENLKRFKPKGRKYNKKVMKIPFFTFRQILASRCFDNSVTLNVIDSWHTSKWCSHCGAVGKGHDSNNYALFRCKCGLVVNSDRKASHAIAVKSLLEREHVLTDNAQISNRRVPVNGLMRSDDVVLQHANQPMECHRL